MIWNNALEFQFKCQLHCHCPVPSARRSQSEALWGAFMEKLNFRPQKMENSLGEFFEIQIRPAELAPYSGFEGSAIGWDLSLLTRNIWNVVIWKYICCTPFIFLIFKDLTSHRSCFRAFHPIFIRIANISRVCEIWTKTRRPESCYLLFPKELPAS